MFAIGVGRKRCTGEKLVFKTPETKILHQCRSPGVAPGVSTILKNTHTRLATIDNAMPEWCHCTAALRPVGGFGACA